ncbi:MAG: recombinase family protein [Actinobacteria bacterium]|nr:recombinase family protein [Actinomycetota bacterium]
MKAAIYTRISDARDDDTAGVRRQEQDCRKLISDKDWDLVDVYCDNNKSATTGFRPEYRRLLEDVRAGEIDVLVAWASDRLYRRTTDLEELVTVLGSVQVVTVRSGDVDLSTADGKTVARLLGAIAQGEVEKRGERVARAARQRAEEGRFGGGTRRFGYTASMEALIEVEAAAIEWAYARILAGGSLREISREWEARGLVGPKGVVITPGVARTILLRPANAGLSVYKGEVVGKSTAPVIVDELTFRQARALLTDPRRRQSPDDGRRTLLSGVLDCGVCGAPVRAHNRSRQRNGKARTGYGCSKSRCVTRSRDRLDEAITELILEYLIKHRVLYRKAPRTASLAAQRASTEAETLRKRLADLAALAGAGELAPQDFAAAARVTRERLAEAESRVTRLAGTPATSRLIKSSDIREAWTTSSLRVRRAIVREVVESITLPVGTPGKFVMTGTTIQWRFRDRDVREDAA